MEQTQKYIYKSAFVRIPYGFTGLETDAAETAIDAKMEVMAALGWELAHTNFTTQGILFLVFRKLVVSASDLDR